MPKHARSVFRPIAVIYQTPRVVPVARAEFLAVWWRMWRVTLIAGPILALGAWWLLHRHAPAFATAGMAVKLLLTALCVPLICGIQGLLLWHPRWSRQMVARWTIHARVLQFAERGFVRWSDIRALDIEVPADESAETELILHLDCVFQSESRRFSLRCLRAEVDPSLLANIRAAIVDGYWCEQHGMSA